MATRRQVNIFINGQQAVTTIKSLSAEKGKLNRELRHMVLGSEEYNQKIREIQKVEGVLREHREKLRGVESTWQKLSKAGVTQFAALTAGAFTVDAIVQYGKELFSLGTQMEVLTQKARTVFGQALPQVTRAAEENAAAMGLTISQYTNAATAIGDLLIPMGFQREEAAAISTNLVDLSGALSEWTGGQIQAEEVSKILSKALLGEREELKQLGIAISEADVQARLAEKGLKGLTGQSLEQAKAAATLELITQKSADAQTAFANNSETLVRRQAEVQAKVAQVSETLATALFPVFERLVDIAATFADGINNLAGAFGDMLDPVGAATSAYNDQAAAVDDLEKNILPLADRYDELTKKATLNKDEEMELESIIKQIGETLPGTIQQVDEYGRILSVNTDAVRENVALQGELAEQYRASAATVIEERIQKLKSQNEQLRDEVNNWDDIVKARALVGVTAKEEERLGLLQQINTNLTETQRLEKELASLRGEGPDAPAGEGPKNEGLSPTKDELLQQAARAEELRKQREKQAEQERQRRQKESERAQKELERQLESLQETTTRFQEEARLAQLDEDERRLEEIRLRYQKEIDAAKELEAQKAEEVTPIIQELYRLQQEALAAARQEIDDALYQAELEALETQLDAELELMAAADAARLEQIEKRNQREQEIRQEEAEKAIQSQIDTLRELEAVSASASSIVGSAIEAIGLAGIENAQLEKQLTLVQIALKTAQGIAGAVAAGIEAGPFPANLGAIAAGIAAVVTGIASARAALSNAPEVPQRALGGWFNAIGQDDGRQYRAKYIGQPATGMLPSHPVLINSASGGSVLASERGAEYFVSNRSLRNPAVLNYVRAIDNIQRHRQFAEGGFTLQPPAVTTAATAAPAADPGAMRELSGVLSQLAGVLSRGIYARLDDDTIIDVRDRLNQLIDASGGVL